jgi:hypothetical protein
MTTTASRFAASSLGTRVASFGLSALITAIALTGLGSIADHQVDSARNDVLLAQAASAPADKHATALHQPRRAVKV